MNLESTVEQARRGRLYPSVILHGADAEARRAAAVTLARAALCEREPAERPCGECRNCRRIAWPAASGAEKQAFHPDFSVLERDLKTATSVDAAKAFLQAAQYTPFEARGQVFVVANAESLSAEAANSLLKNLEEPHLSAPRNFLLLAPSQFDLLPTLRSRSLAVYLEAGRRQRSADLEAPAAAFRTALDAYLESGNDAELLSAAAALGEVGGFKDARAQEPWEQAATVVLQTARDDGLDAEVRRRLLRLAEELLGAFRSRVRGITAPRILEGLVGGALARPAEGSGGHRP